MPATLAAFIAYFTRLGALGFGGPVALANRMRRDLVDDRGWIAPDEFEDGLALAAACPGPLAYQLGVYCGYIRFGIRGALAVAVAFGLPPFLLVTAGAAVYRHFASDWHLRALFYGIAPVVVAIILKACWNLGAKTLRRDAIAWTFAVVACAITAILQREIAWLFIAAGILGMIVFAPPPRVTSSTALSIGALPQLFLFFFKTGLLVFGSGLVIVPFLKTQVVDQFHWLDDRTFLDAVAIGMISPGPVVITATFVGYLLAGAAGAVAATAGIFSPPVLFVVIATPLLLRHRAHPRLRGFIRGVSSAVVGVLVGTTWLVGRTAIVDVTSLVIGVTALLLILFAKRIPEPLVIAAGGVAGLVAFVH